MFCGIHLNAISLEMLMNLICNMSSKIILLKLLPHLPGDNKLTFVMIFIHFETGMSEWLSLMAFFRTVDTVRQVDDEMEKMLCKEFIYYGMDPSSVQVH